MQNKSQLGFCNEACVQTESSARLLQASLQPRRPKQRAGREPVQPMSRFGCGAQLELCSTSKTRRWLMLEVGGARNAAEPQTFWIFPRDMMHQLSSLFLFKSSKSAAPGVSADSRPFQERPSTLPMSEAATLLLLCVFRKRM